MVDYGNNFMILGAVMFGIGIFAAYTLYDENEDASFSSVFLTGIAAFFLLAGGAYFYHGYTY